jgi:hypothetical protein
MEIGLWILGLISASLISNGDGTWRLPTNSMNEPCPFPLDPLLMRGQPIGMYHCPYCGDMVIAGVPHGDWSTLGDDLPELLGPEPDASEVF